MDRTLKPAKRSNKRRQRRNWQAWQRLSPDGKKCRFCPHENTAHLSSAAQPHFYRPATKEEKRDSSLTLYHHLDPGAGYLLLRRVTVAKHAEIITTFCRTCAEELRTDQVLCYQRTLAVGEVVGIGRNGAKQNKETNLDSKGGKE